MVTAWVKEMHERVLRSVADYWERNAVMGHGIDHANRCYAHALRIARAEGADPLPVGVACYLMDTGLSPDKGRKDHVARSLEIAARVIRTIPELQPAKDLIMTAVLYHDADDFIPTNAAIEVVAVRDSDTLDRLGFTGIRMTLTYGVWMSRRLYDPIDPFCLRRPIQVDGFTIDYIKHLFSLTNRLITPTAKTLGFIKSDEMSAYCQSFGLLCSGSEALTYDDAYGLLGKMQSLGA